MIDIDDYTANLDQVTQTHKGSLKGAFERELRLARSRASTGEKTEHWWSYEGRETKPFLMCTRLEDTRFVICVIAGKPQCAGRMPLICDALETLGVGIVFEDISNPGLEGYLRARGYRPTPDAKADRPSLWLFTPHPS